MSTSSSGSCFVRSKSLRVSLGRRLPATASVSDTTIRIDVEDASERFFFYLVVAATRDLPGRLLIRVGLHRLLQAVWRRRDVSATSIAFSALLRELERPKDVLEPERRLTITVNFLLPTNNDGFVIIRAWSSIVLEWLSKRYKYECYGAFLSTLGGAYSSLGEDSLVFAKQAEKISVRQLALAIAFDDPNAIARCRLFLAFSHIQLGKLREADALLRSEYAALKEAKRGPARITDARLKVMCVAGIKKLRFVASNLDPNRRHQRHRSSES